MATFRGTLSPLGWMAVGVLLTGAPPLLAQNVFHVANNGVDTPTCGTGDRPCRSISRAIEVAQPGDAVQVGPGIYGDIDGDGAANRAGEEVLRNGVMVTLDKPVAVYSQVGAGATTIKAPQTPEMSAVVSIVANGASLGRPNRGFTIVGVSDSVASRGIFASAGDVQITSNVVLDNGSEGFSLNLEGGRVTVSDNLSMRNNTGFIVLSQNSSSFAVLDRNVASDNRQVGFLSFGRPHTFANNLATRNQTGFGLNARNLPSGSRVVRGVASWCRNPGGLSRAEFFNEPIRGRFSFTRESSDA